jgi:hypothetical protein
MRAWLGVLDGMRNGRYIRSDLNFQPETDLWIQLLKANTVKQVRAVCDQSQYWLNLSMANYKNGFSRMF